jgi:Phage integrase family
VLSDQELQCIWRACEERLTRKEAEGGDLVIQLPTNFTTIVQLLILTGQRRGEISALRPAYIDLQEQTICLPNHLVKNSREHLFPINALTAKKLSTAIKHAQNTDFIFPARRNVGGPFNGWSKSKAALDKLCGVTVWTLHDLRRTFATRLAEMGVAPHIIERYEGFYFSAIAMFSVACCSFLMSPQSNLISLNDQLLLRVRSHVPSPSPESKTASQPTFEAHTSQSPLHEAESEQVPEPQLPAAPEPIQSLPAVISPTPVTPMPPQQGLALKLNPTLRCCGMPAAAPRYRLG